MKLTQRNYYGPKASKEYMSVSQFKDFLKCPAMAMAKLNRKYAPERGRALLLGSYVDEMLTGTKKTLDKFIEENRAELFKKNGDPYADVEQAEDTVERVRKQPLMMHYLGGKHQVIMTGEIEGVPFKIKMDSFDPKEYITDLKYMASLRSPNLFTPMVEYWGYDLQAACYQEVVYQNTGKRLPFYFDVATKEKPAHLAVGQISQWNIDKAMETVRANIVRFQKIKTGELEADRCEDYNCEFCTTTKIITEAIDTDMFGMSAAQIRGMRGDI
ncbi:PD-(D/E)XK nuclease-like domain-containing protein [Succinimonas sp.]|uniref:PD-(D/E)XK nuclease-like domain-containing protein n=1 Tax=Succinimonas sp. TaxID=1936151 RepID=UPI00386E17D8